MPQGGRGVPFSGKAKKKQMLQKREKKRGGDSSDDRSQARAKKSETNECTTDCMSRSDSIGPCCRHRVKQQPDSGGYGQAGKAAASGHPRSKNTNANRYTLQFRKDTKDEIMKRKEESRKTLVPVSEVAFEVSDDQVFPQGLELPKRPRWDFSTSKSQLEMAEQKYFRLYLETIEKTFPTEELSYFELNLETWRQLWRVLEISDILLVIVDIRFPVYMLPPSLCEHVTNELNKNIIVVLNKIDLAPAPLVVAWIEYFKSKYPKNLHVVPFTSMPGYNLRGNVDQTAEGLKIRRKKGKLKMASEGSLRLLEACENIVEGQVNIDSWRKKIMEEAEHLFDDTPIEIGDKIMVHDVDTSYVSHEKYKDGVLTIGCLGQPNVGKSSLINAVMGKKVVSVSRTPGHTKHFQTIYLTLNIRLCDCPGLVFPSKVPLHLQVILGSYPIAQLREPFSVVKYLAERIDLPKLLKLHHPEGDEEWSALDVCDGYALKRGFRTAKAARLDSYRAANALLRMTLDGKICLCLYPPGYTTRKEYWATHTDVSDICHIQAKTGEEADKSDVSDFEFSDDEERLRAPKTAKGERKGSSSREKEESGSDEDVPIVSQSRFAALQS